MKIKKKYNHEYSIRFFKSANGPWRKWAVKYFFPRFGRLKKANVNSYIFYTDNTLRGDYKYMDIKRIG